MVREMRVPSSSSSGGSQYHRGGSRHGRERTDGDGRDLDTLFDVCGVGILGVLVLEHLLSTERVDECGPT